MAKPLTIGLFAQGGKEWVGGAELTKNLIVATLRFCKLEGLPVAFKLIGERSSMDSITSGFDDGESIEWIESPQTNWTIATKVRRRLGFDPSKDAVLKMVRRHKIDFLYPTNFNFERNDCSTAAWIFDFQHKYMPELFNREELRSRDESFESLAKNSETVVLSSEAARNDFARFFPSYASKAKTLSFRVHIPNEWNIDNPRKVADQYCLPPKFLIVCNQFWMHKNHTVIVDALSQAVKEYPDMVVAMTGRLTDYRNVAYVDNLLEKIHKAGVYNNVRLLGLVPKRTQVALLRASTAVIQPSLFEGWSTIVEECHALGKPILLSDVEVHREQAPPHAHYFRPHDHNLLASLMCKIWSEPDKTNAINQYADKILEFGKQFYQICN